MVNIQNLVLTLAVVVSGCGDVNVSDPKVTVDTDGVKTEEAKSKWTDEEINDAQLSCYGSVTGDGYSDAQAKSYCGCVIDEASSRWTAQEFVDGDKISVLQDDGTLESCAEPLRPKQATSESETVIKTTESKTVETTTVIKQKDYSAATLLVRGMPKTDVLRILGTPTAITYEYWEYTENPHNLKVCANSLGYEYIDASCQVFFDDDDLLFDQYDISTEYIDVINF